MLVLPVRARVAWCLTGLVLAFAGVTVGQQTSPGKGKNPQAKDPQAAVEPRSKPGEGQTYLKKFEGDWEVAKAFFPRTGPAVRQKGQCRQSMIHDGRFLQSDFTFGDGVAKTTGKGLIGYETATGQFTSVWIDSRATSMSFRSSQARFDGKEIVLHARALTEGKKARVSRTVTRLEDNGKRITHRQYNPTDDGKERLLMELILTRKTNSGDK